MQEKLELNNNYENCICQTLHDHVKFNVIDEFPKVRENCPVLKNVLFPNKIWDKFNATVIKQLFNDDAIHNYTTLLAYERGKLSYYTSPIHRFLLDGKGEIRTKAEKGYIGSLKENWMGKIRENEKLQYVNKFQGKLKELQFAYYLEKEGWSLKSLEALGDLNDICAIDSDDNFYDIEVKYIGSEVWFLKKVLSSLNDEIDTEQPSPYHSRNYLLKIIYEASKQLLTSKSKNLKLVTVLIEHFNHYAVIFDKNLLKTENIEFIRGGEEWNNILKDTKNDFPNIENELTDVIQSVDEIRIYSMKSCGFQLERKIVKKATNISDSLRTPRSLR